MALDKRSARANRRMWRSMLTGTLERKPRAPRARCAACLKAIYADRLAADQAVLNLQALGIPGGMERVPGALRRVAPHEPRLSLWPCPCGRAVHPVEPRAA